MRDARTEKRQLDLDEGSKLENAKQWHICECVFQEWLPCSPTPPRPVFEWRDQHAKLSEQFSERKRDCRTEVDYPLSTVGCADGPLSSGGPRSSLLLYLSRLLVDLPLPAQFPILK